MNRAPYSGSPFQTKARSRTFSTAVPQVARALPAGDVDVGVAALSAGAAGAQPSNYMLGDGKGGFRKAKDITAERLYLDTMEEVLRGGAKAVTSATSSSTRSDKVGFGGISNILSRKPGRMDTIADRLSRQDGSAPHPDIPLDSQPVDLRLESSPRLVALLPGRLRDHRWQRPVDRDRNEGHPEATERSTQVSDRRIDRAQLSIPESACQQKEPYPR